MGHKLPHPLQAGNDPSANGQQQQYPKYDSRYKGQNGEAS